MIGLNNSTGSAIDGNAHLAQSIGDILSTPIGTRVMRRNYGSMLFELIDAPLNAATLLLINAASAIALQRWEPRIRLKKVKAAIDAASGAVTLDLEGDRADLPPANAHVSLSIPIRRGGAPTN